MFEIKKAVDPPSRARFQNTEDLRERIRILKKDLNAVLLAHYYQESEIQDLADFVGDSLELSRRAAETQADVIVFAGVHFMAETAKLLNPTKKVLLPDLAAGCSLADSCPAPQFEAFRRQHPDHIAISYINCSAGVKALSDLICTSSNAEKMIRSVPENQKIIFAPDKNLGRYLAKKTGRDMLIWQGACIVHDTFSDRKIIHLQMEHPNAKLAAHPECEEAVLNWADFIGSTTGILRYVQSTDFKEYIIATEPGIIHQMERTCPGKVFIPAPPEANCACNECPYMKLNTLEKLHACMEDLYPEIQLPEEIMDRAAYPIHRMLQLS